MEETRDTAPADTEGSEAVQYAIKDRKVVFESFPIESIVTLLVGEDLAEATVAQIGEVDYSIDFTAVFNEDKGEVSLTLSPRQLTITVPAVADEDDDDEEGEENVSRSEGEDDDDDDDNGNDNEGDEKDIQIVVTVTADTEGVYVVDSKKNTFSLKVEKISVDGTELDGFETLVLDFDASKK